MSPKATRQQSGKVTVCNDFKGIRPIFGVNPKNRYVLDQLLGNKGLFHFLSQKVVDLFAQGEPSTVG